MNNDPVTQRIAQFLISIGLEVRREHLAGKTFLPGILIKNGAIVFDEEKLRYPGDLLHEAGHLAVAPAAIRNQLSDEVELPDFNIDALESAAMLWSYAAALALEIDPRVVFHADGYHGNAENLLFNFSLGVYLGVNILEEAEMTATGANAVRRGVEPFPAMLKWLRG